MHRYLYCLVGLFFCKPLSSWSQRLSPQVVATAGGSVSTGDYQLSFTVGQSLTVLLTSANGILTQGFQQGSPKNLITAIDPLPSLNLRVFPNPVSRYLRLEGPAGSLTLVDLLGRTRWLGHSNGNPRVIDLCDFPDGLYLLIWQTEHSTLSTRIVLQH